MNIGAKATLSRKFDEPSVLAFADLSGDHNPIHINAEYAKKSRFGAQIVHGFFVGSLISAVLASKIPGEGSIYLKQEMSFLKPVFLGDEITAEVEVIENPKPTIYILATRCRNQAGDLVIDGKATVKVPHA